MKYLEALNEQKFVSRIGNKKLFIIEGLGTAVDKEKADVAIQSMQDSLERHGYSIQITQAGRFGFDKRGGWQFDDSMTAQGHPSSWIPGSRGYYAISQKSVVLFPKNDYQFVNDKPENSKLTYKQDLEQAFKKKIGILEGKNMKSRLEQYLEAIKPDVDSMLEKKLHNLDRDELIDMIRMYRLKISKRDINDSDDDELIDYLLTGLKANDKIKLAEE